MNMKNLVFCIILICICISTYAQTYTLTFTGQDSNGQHIPLQKVHINNITQQWSDTLWYPDTILIIHTTGIHDWSQKSNFKLMQNTPNPFDGTTNFSIQIPQKDELHITVYDILGNLITSFNDQLPAGLYTFELRLKNPQTYLLCAYYGKNEEVIKIINQGHHSLNSISLKSEEKKENPTHSQSKQPKGEGVYPVQVGDMMQYIGYTTVNNIEYTDEKNLQFNESESIIFQFDIPEAPTVITSSVTDISSISAILSGKVMNDGGVNVTERGFCFGDHPYIDITGPHFDCGNGIGTFSYELTGLESSTTYYVCAYAINEMGISYGNIISFTPLSFYCGTDSVLDHEQNVYHTVKIGSQCWLKENMRCTTSPSTGTYIVHIKDNTYHSAYSGKRAYFPNNDSILAMGPAGVLYNWCAAVDTFNTTYGELSAVSTAPNVVFNGHRQGICPEGWHIPTSDEYDELFVFINTDSTNRCNNTDGSIAKALASEEGWAVSYSSCTPGNAPNSNNSSDLSIYPSEFNSSGLGTRCNLICANQNGQNNTWGRSISNNYATVYGAINAKSYGLTVRCLRDTPSGYTIYFQPNGGAGKILPQHFNVGETCTLSANTFVHNGYIFSGWNTEPTGNGTSYQDEEIITLSENMTLYAQWDVEPSQLDLSNLTSCVVNTAYSNEVAHGDRITSVLDHQNNSYGVVQIGNQCWLRENMRCTTSPSTGTYIVNCPAVSLSYGGKKAYYLNNDTLTAVAGRGLLYNWCAAIDSSSGSNETATIVWSSGALSAVFTGHRRGICPAGWHIPSNQEWVDLSNYIATQAECRCNNSQWYNAKSLTSDWGWGYSYTPCAIGNVQQYNNVTGFSAFPMGDYYNDHNHDTTYFASAGKTAKFWTSSQDEDGTPSSSAWEVYLNFDDPELFQQLTYKTNGNSVRCLRD